MYTGTVVWFNENQGFGFITGDEGGNKLFFTTAQRDAFTIGQAVTFETEKNPCNGRPMAVRVSPSRGK